MLADSVNVFGVRQRGHISVADGAADKEGCFAVCSYTERMPCFKTTVINSIVAGCFYVGFLAPGYSCTDPVGQSSTIVFKNNVAHSIDGSGFCVFPDVAKKD